MENKLIEEPFEENIVTCFLDESRECNSTCAAFVDKGHPCVFVKTAISMAISIRSVSDNLKKLADILKNKRQNTQDSPPPAIG